MTDQDDQPHRKLSQCEGKVRLTWQRANQINQRERSKDKGRSAYRCSICKGWHLGSTRKTRRS